MPRSIFVIPAKAGIQRFPLASWMPAFAGMTTKELVQSFLRTRSRRRAASDIIAVQASPQAMRCGAVRKRTLHIYIQAFT